MKDYDWDSIGITDSIMFDSVFSDPALARSLLERVLGIPILKVEHVATEMTVIPGLGTRGIRMDVYVLDEEGSVYNVEMQNANEGNLLKRSRYYQGTIDKDCISPGQAFDKLRDSFVVFICTFDPFGDGLARYTIRPYCLENQSLQPDGSTRVFINARAWNNCDDERLKPFLQYLSGDTMVSDTFSQEVDSKVRSLRASARWRGEYKMMSLYLSDLEARAIERGLEQGLERGREEERSLNAQLAERLRELGRSDELTDAMVDSAVRDKLLAELGIGV